MMIDYNLRPEQKDYSDNVLSFLQSDKKITIIQADTGIGKTRGYLAAISELFNDINNNKRCIIATNTRNLRNQCVEDINTINQIRKSNNIPELKFCVKRSMSEIASLEIATHLHKQITVDNGYTQEEKNNAKNYLNWVTDTLTKASIQFDINQLPFLVEYANDLPTLKDNTDRTYFLTENEVLLKGEHITSTVVQEFRNYHSNSINDANIILTTHAMLLFNNECYGTILKTHADDNIDTIIINDETDLMYGAAKNIKSTTINFSEIKKFSIDCKVNNKIQTKNFLQFLEKNKKELYADQRNQLIKHFDSFLRITEESAGNDPALEFKYKKFFDAYEDIVAYHNMDDWQANVITCKIGNDHSINLEYPPNLVINRIWRSKNNISKVMFTAAKMNDLDNPKEFKTIKRLLGIAAKDQHMLYNPVIINVKSFGQISKLYLADREMIVSPVRDQKTWCPSQEYISYTAECIKKIAEQDDKKTLVLFTSNVFKNAVMNSLPKDIQDSVVMRKPNQTFEASFDIFKNQNKQFWFGHDWHGANFVENGETTIKRIVIPSIPITPPHSQIKNKDNAWDVSLFEGAIRLVQGIGRGIRNQIDEPEVWILDPRMCVPPSFGKSFDGNPKNATQDNLKKSKLIADAIPTRMLKNTELKIIKIKNDTSVSLSDF